MPLKLMCDQTVVISQNHPSPSTDSVPRYKQLEFNSLERIQFPFVSWTVEYFIYIFLSSLVKSLLTKSRNICSQGQQGTEIKKDESSRVFCLLIRQLRRHNCVSMSDNKWSVGHAALWARLKIRTTIIKFSATLTCSRQNHYKKRTIQRGLSWVKFW